MEQGLAQEALLAEYARAADVRQDWPEAVRRWTMLQNRMPASVEAAVGLGAALLSARMLVVFGTKATSFRFAMRVYSVLSVFTSATAGLAVARSAEAVQATQEVE